MRVENVKSLVAPLLILLLGFLAMVELTGLREELPARPPAAKARVVNTLVVEPGVLQARLLAWGRLQSAQPVVLLSEAEGVLMAGEVPFRQGQGFKRGQLLLRVDDRQKRLQLNRSKSDFINAMAAVLPEIKQQYPKQWADWNRYFDRLQVDKPLPTMPAAKVEKIKRLLARHNAYQIYYAVRIEEIALEKYRIRAPFDGTIIDTSLHTGANARLGTRLGEILNLEQLELVLQLPAVDLPWLDTDGEVVVRSSQFEGSWRGRIDRVGSHVDESTQTVPVFVTLAGEQADLPAMAGLLLEAELPGKTVTDAVSVPLKNLYGDNEVYLLLDGALEKRPVTVLRREAQRAIVTSGLEPGDRLVTDLLEGVAPGMEAISREQFQQESQDQSQDQSEKPPQQQSKQS